jgi:DNA-binding MarR family transcriptional regulator
VSRPARPGKETASRPLTDADYRRLLAFRTALRRFLRWSDAEAVGAGLTSAQHQLLLAIRGHRDPAGPSVSDVADALVTHHHGAVGLIDRAAAAGLVERRRDPHDHRVVRLALTPTGSRRLAELSARHVQELARVHRLRPLWDSVNGSSPLGSRSDHPGADDEVRPS